MPGGGQAFQSNTGVELSAVKSSENRHSYLLDSSNRDLKMRGGDCNETYEEEKKEVGHHREDHRVSAYDQSVMSSPGGPLD